MKNNKKYIVLIAAINKKRAIGSKGTLLYSIEKDMQHFLKQTKNHTVVMGRKTWESIPQKFRPLKDRDNIIVTRNNNYKAEGAQIVDKFYKSLNIASPEKKIYVIGGGEIYKQALSYANELDITLIHNNDSADVYFPDYEKFFVLESSSLIQTDQNSGLKYQFQTYFKK